VIFAFLGVSATAVRADALYSVTNLGNANASGNYLGALSPADQAAFQAGSFDVFAHPANVTSLPVFHQGDVVRRDLLDGDDILSGAAMVTSNNLGMNAGTATETLPPTADFPTTQLVVFRPDPHTVQDPSNPGVTVQSPGYLVPYFTDSNSNFGQFTGSVAGINDHQAIATTEINGNGIHVPYLQGAGGSNSGAIDLGNLGGSNAVANALNNANQVVGWSQVFGGAEHAFLYSNGTMQDLNLLIPPLSGITLTSALAIDGSGRIVASGTESSGQTEEFLLTPTAVPEPSTLACFGLAIVAVAARQVRLQRRAACGRSRLRSSPA
jgi:probable HAF family extracellular repeat protein